MFMNRQYRQPKTAWKFELRSPFTYAAKKTDPLKLLSLNSAARPTFKNLYQGKRVRLSFAA